MTRVSAIFSVFIESEKSWKLTPPGGTSGIKGSNWFQWWWNFSEQVKVKRLANKTTHHRGSSGTGKTTKWKHMIGQADSDDGVRKPRLIWQRQADKMTVTRGKMDGFIFTQAWNQGTLLEVGFILHKLETKINYAWNQFHFYTSLKRKQTMLEKVSMPPAWWLNSRYMPPKLQSI